jgi:hypothetical protein
LASFTDFEPGALGLTSSGSSRKAENRHWRTVDQNGFVYMNASEARMTTP